MLSLHQPALLSTLSSMRSRPAGPQGMGSGVLYTQLKAWHAQSEKVAVPLLKVGGQGESSVFKGPRADKCLRYGPRSSL
uniref:Uncharacterized protein n=1 Tax=Knipowitschia caucasica TaxID=637954 RepID=A0AAV2KTT8_KNICA